MKWTVCALLLGTCAPEAPAGVSAPAAPPESGPPASGTVTPAGGTVDRLYFAVTGDTRPPSCDATDQYPRGAIADVASAMKALKAQFALDLGDHMFVCNGSDPEARQQMGFYMAAVAQGPSPWFMTMGNHECGRPPCSTSGPHDANFAAYLDALGRPEPYYSFDVRTSFGFARFVVVADDAWDPRQAAWLEERLADADAHARYTFVARHHPLTGSRTGNPLVIEAITRHRYTLILSAHDHHYSHDAAAFGGRSVVIGLGGAPSWSSPGFGIVLQNRDGSITFTRYDALGMPAGESWSVRPQ